MVFGNVKGELKGRKEKAGKAQSLTIYAEQGRGNGQETDTSRNKRKCLEKEGREQIQP